MGVTNILLEGTPGAAPSVPTSGSFFATWVYDSAPNHNSSDAALSTAYAHSGSTSLRLHSGTRYAMMQAAAAPTVTYFRTYIDTNAAWTTRNIALFMRIADGFGRYEWFGLSPDRGFLYKSQTSPDTNYSDVSASSSLWTPGERIRVEAKLGSGVTPEIRLWRDGGSGGIDSTGTAHASWTGGANGAGTTDNLWLGATAVDYEWTFQPFLSSGEEIFLDDMALGDTGWIGPAPDANPYSGTSYAGIVRI